MLKVSKNANELVGDSSDSIQWKRRPSEIKGYQRALYLNDNDGSYIRLDYNLKTKKVRIFYEPSDEGGVSYYSVIENGDIIQEKNVASGRATNLTHKFTRFAPKIATIPNKEVLKIIGENYGLSGYEKEQKEKEKKKKLETTRKRYFGQETAEKESTVGDFDETKKISRWDFIDLGVGAGVGGGLFYFLASFEYLGLFLGVYGILMGIFDIFIRQREPIFIKIVLFMLAGLAAYIYGYYIY